MRLLLLLLLLPLLTNSEGIEVPKVVDKANFVETYNHLRAYEGNYVYHINDKGGETYAGITRRYNPEWYGWKYVDRYPNKRHTYVPEAEFWVKDYYLTIWVREGFYLLENQDVANFLFDTRIHLSKRQTIKLLRRMGITTDESEWAAGLDSLDVGELRKLRTGYYYRLVSRNPRQKVFIKGWIKRVSV
jgi:hypothetical protein